MTISNGLKRVMTLVAYGATTLSVLAGAAVWVDTHYAKAADVQAIQQDVRCLSRDLRLGQLRTHQLLLARELAEVEAARRHRALSAIEIQRAGDLLLELQHIDETQKMLQVMRDCP